MMDLKQIIHDNWNRCNMGPREKGVLMLRFGMYGGKPSTLREIGEKIGLSQERIRQIQNVALRKVRRAQEKRTGEAYRP
jgi:DNA-directed RNA polymerase sigma subunit (sigma70/sigma32)